MANDRGLDRFVVELGPIVNVPGGNSSWRGNFQRKLQGQEDRRVLGRLFPECSAAPDGDRTRSDHRKEAKKHGQEQPKIRSVSCNVQGVVVDGSIQFADLESNRSSTIHATATTKATTIVVVAEIPAPRWSQGCANAARIPTIPVIQSHFGGLRCICQFPQTHSEISLETNHPT